MGDTWAMGSILGSGRSPEVGNGNSLQYCCLGNPMEWGAWRAIVHEVTKSQTGLSMHALKVATCPILTVFLRVYGLPGTLLSWTISLIYCMVTVKCSSQRTGRKSACLIIFPSVQFISVAQSYPTLCDPMDCSTPGRPVHHQLWEFTQTHVHWGNVDAIQPSYLLLSPSSNFNLSQHQVLFKRVSSSHQVATVL